MRDEGAGDFININCFYDLDVWKVAHELVLSIYEITAHFPQSEKYGLVSQMQRAVSSVTANIAEGFSRYHYKDKIRFYYISRGSLSEAQNFLLVSRDLSYIDTVKFNCCWDHVEKTRKILEQLYLRQYAPF